MWHPIESLLNQASIGQSRTSVLNPIQWFVAILLSGFCIALIVHAPTWFTVLVGVGVGLAFALFFGAYIYFCKKDPDALRSENYSLTKLAIEKRFLGDSNVGLQLVGSAEEHSAGKLLSLEASETGEQKR
jgi:hypothetical protein